MQPLVSIVIPAYNGAEQLRRVIPMLDAQTYSPLEIVVVDDGSADNTPAVLARLAESRPGLRWVRQDNGGAGAARNRGVAEAKGDFVAFLDCDDIWPDNAVQARMAPFLDEDDPEIMGVYCPADFIDEQGGKILEGPLFDYVQPFDRIYFTSVMGSPFVPSCAIVRKAAFDAVGGFHSELSPAEDFDLWQRMLRTGGCFFKVSTCRIGWVQHPGSTVHTRLAFHHDQCVKVLDAIYSGSQDGPWLPEFSGPMGDILARKEETGRGLSQATMAAAVGSLDTARAISASIALPFMKQQPVDRLLWTIRFNTLRALCRREADWDTVWGEVGHLILKFLNDLDTQLGGCRNLHALIARLEGPLETEDDPCA
jgi:GT2 family glycosyltransferase